MGPGAGKCLEEVRRGIFAILSVLQNLFLLYKCRDILPREYVCKFL